MLTGKRIYTVREILAREVHDGDLRRALPKLEVLLDRISAASAREKNCSLEEFVFGDWNIDRVRLDEGLSGDAAIGVFVGVALVTGLRPIDLVNDIRKAQRPRSGP